MRASCREVPGMCAEVTVSVMVVGPLGRCSFSSRHCQHSGPSLIPVDPWQMSSCPALETGHQSVPTDVTLAPPTLQSPGLGRLPLSAVGPPLDLPWPPPEIGWGRGVSSAFVRLQGIRGWWGRRGGVKLLSDPHRSPNPHSLFQASRDLWF